MSKIQKALVVFNFLIASVWLINGLYCKVLGFVPRHEQIVARILGPTWSHPLTIAIGCSEVLMAIVILSRRFTVLVTWSQIVLVLTMNILEYLFAQDLLLHGKMNIVYACLFVLFLYLYLITYLKYYTKNDA